MNASKKKKKTACFLLIVLTFLLLVPPARGSAHEGNGGGVTGVDDYGVDLYEYYSMTDLDMKEGETLQPFTLTTRPPPMNDELGEDDVNNSNIVTQEEITRNGADFFGGGDTMPSYPSYPDPYASPFYYGPAAGGAVSGDPPLAPPANAVSGRGRRGRKKPRVQKPRRRGRRGTRTTTRRGRRGRRPSYGHAMPPPPPPYYYGGYLAAGGQHYYHYPHPAYYSYYYPPVVYPTTNYYYPPVPPSYPMSYYDGGGGGNYLYPGAGEPGGGGGCPELACVAVNCNSFAGYFSTNFDEVDPRGCPVCPRCALRPGFGIRNARGSAEAPAPDDDDFLKEGDV